MSALGSDKSTAVPADDVKPAARGRLLQSGIFLATASLLTGAGNYVFQGIMGRQLEHAEFGYFNSTLGLIALLSLPIAIASNAVTHYIAHFDATGDRERLLVLLGGCRKFLISLMIVGFLLAAVLAKPLSDFFHFPRTSLMLTALACVLATSWGTFANVLCQGLGWFGRLALIGLGAVALRLLFGGLATLKYPAAEAAALATGVAVLANLVVLYWNRHLFKPGGAVSPWNREFAGYLTVAAACVGGGYCFTQGDLLVAQRYLPGEALGYYTAAGVLARALPIVVAPLLTVLFTSRSSHRAGDIVHEQLKLLGLYAVGLLGGAGTLLVLRGFCVKMIFGKAVPEAELMVGWLALTMVFVGLLQGLAMWALASRWLKAALTYGVLGLAYWGTLLLLGRTQPMLLHVMPAAAGVALGILLIVWLASLRQAGTGGTDVSRAQK